MSIQLVIIDDHAVLRAGLRALLDAQDDLQVVGEAGDAAEGIRAVKEHHPDVVLLDLAMPGQGGLSIISTLRQVSPESRVLVLTMHDDPAYLRPAFDAGASGFVVKTSADSDLLKAIRAVHNGRSFIDRSFDPRVMESVAKRAATRSAKGTLGTWDTIKPLSAREHEVLQLLAHGHTNQEAADRLELSVKSVETYRSRLMEKLGLRSRAELIRYALDHGLLKPKKTIAVT